MQQEFEAGSVSFMQGGGEMGERIRAFDWSSTPVGPPEIWPQSLRTALGILMDSGYPMYLAWGREFTQFYNDAYRPILGSTKHPGALGASTTRTFAEIWDFIGPMFREVLRTGRASTFADQLLPLERHGFAEECYFTFSYSAVRTETGEVGGVFVTVLETTERVLRERRERTVRDLYAIESRESPTAILAAAEEVLGRNPNDLPFARFEAPSETASDLELSDLSEPIASAPWPQPVRRMASVPVVPPGSGASVARLVAGISPRLAVDDAYSTFLRTVARTVASLIAEAKALEAERERAEALAELDRAKTAFFSNVSHEFRTPLTLLLSPLEDALAGANLPAEAREELRVVHRNAVRLHKLVNTLLDFARIEAGRVDASYEPVDLAAFTTELASVFRSAIEAADLELVVDCPELPEPVYVDRAMWEKIVFNFLSNALKFTFEGRVSVRVAAGDGRAELTIEDTGTGIPEADLPHVFERFRRVQEARSRTHEGTGIGLALVKELVALHGGEVRVESALGEGTRFTVSIPFGAEHLPAERVRAARLLATTALRGEIYVEEALQWLPGETASDGEDALPTSAADGDVRVLLADDNADMREYVRRVLGQRWHVDAVADGLQALEVVARERPDVVVTDVMMPNLDGFGLLEELRSSPSTRSIPVLMLSARAGEESKVEGLTAGADDYLIKPFSARELMARVETQLMRSRVAKMEDELSRRLAAVFSEAPVAVAMLRGPDHVFEYANDAYREAVARARVVGRSFRDVFPELAGQGIYELLDRVYETGERFVGHSVPYLMQADGAAEPEERFFDFVMEKRVEDSAGVDGITVVAYDVTELARARRNAESASRAKDEFMAVLGHELRNPLAPLGTALQLLRMRADLGCDNELSIMERQLGHMKRLVDDLLDVSRVTSGKIELRREPTELAEIVGQAVEVAAPLLEERAQHFSNRVPKSGLLVNADPIRLSQVVSNLLTNAAKYTPEGGHVEIRARSRGAEVELTVVDDGIGIDPDQLPRVFDAFFQAPRGPNRLSRGLGVGLAIASSLATLHEGSLSAHSEGRNRGSTFTLRLPIVSEREAAQPAPGPKSARGAVKKGRGTRILVVDDNADAAASLAMLLVAMGHTVRVAHDGPAAMREAETFAPDVALLDIGLPVMNGYELARRLRELPGLEHIKLVALTGYGAESDRARAAAAGFDEHVVKPVEPQHLDELVGTPAEQTISE